MESNTTGHRPTILAIEDDGAIRRLLRSSFDTNEYRLIEAESAQEGIEAITKRKPDVVLLDLGLPDQDGLSVVTTVRGWSQVPIIILSAQGQEDIKVQVLEAGADDYITKPFGVSELLARVKVALRRTAFSPSAGEDPIFEAAQLRLDRASRKVWVHGEEVHLTPIEYKLLCVLVQYAGRVVTHRQLLGEVWGSEYSEDSQYLRVYIGYLRRKIEPNEDSDKILVNEPRVGYRLAV
jgi:two-component system, OmpR family, KDP operon response regulator KdpE